MSGKCWRNLDLGDEEPTIENQGNTICFLFFIIVIYIYFVLPHPTPPPNLKKIKKNQLFISVILITYLVE